MSKIIDISDELKLVSFGNGVKLIKPFLKEENTIKNLLRLPFAVYLSDIEHIPRVGNEITAEECGYLSIKDYIGKPWYQYFKSNSIAEPLSNCKEILTQEICKITYENALRNDGSSNDTLSIRMPWYDEDNKIIGLFGCSIILSKNPLAESLTHIVNLGFLNPNQMTQTQQLMGSHIGSVYLSKRELDCLRLTIRGKTAKQIAVILNLSKWTVEEYLANIKIKMKVSSKSELIDKTIDYLIK